MKKSLLLSSLLLTSTIYAQTSLNVNEFTLTNISLDMDENGNLNPNITLPFYYGESNKYYTSVSFKSSNYSDTKEVRGFSDSKNATFTTSKDFTLNYFTYVAKPFGLRTSIGIESTFSTVDNNEFGYIHDINGDFGTAGDYYSFDNTIELDIRRHSLRADIVIPMGSFFSSRIFGSISPYTTIGVKQSTIFKPLVTETGTSDSTTSQDLSYTLKYDGLIKTGTFVDIGIFASYDSQALKYDLAQLSRVNNQVVFKTSTVDTTETTTRAILRLLLNIDVLGGLHPSIGYGQEKIKLKDNSTGDDTSFTNNIFTLSVEKPF